MLRTFHLVTVELYWLRFNFNFPFFFLLRQTQWIIISGSFSIRTILMADFMPIFVSQCIAALFQSIQWWCSSFNVKLLCGYSLAQILSSTNYFLWATLNCGYFSWLPSLEKWLPCGQSRYHVFTYCLNRLFH